jgi:hypothetical protein
MRKIIFILCFLLVFPVFAQEEEQNPYEIALQEIEEARISRATSLELYILGLTELPPEIGELSQLRVLYVFDTNIQTLPPEIGNLEHLEMLWLYQNQIISLPAEIGNLENLLVLSLANNQLSSLPPEIVKLKNLCYLDLKYNNFSHLPLEIGQLPSEAYGFPCDGELFIYVTGNPLISPPPEVVAQGTPAILEYLRNEALWHLKRLILGGASFAGVITVVVLGIRWRNHRRKGKKRGE